MEIRLFNGVAVNFFELAEHDKTVLCLLAAEANQWPDFCAEMRRQGVAPDDLWSAKTARHAYQVKSVGFGDHDHV